MEYLVHGHPFVHDGSECGIYQSHSPVGRMEYSVMDPDLLVCGLNKLPLEQAIEALVELRDRAAQQADWNHTPQNLGFPILRQVPGPSMSINEIRENLRNTERFCGDVLKALEGK